MRLLIDADIVAYRVAWATEMLLADYLKDGVLVRTEVLKGYTVPEPKAGEEVVVYHQLEEEEDVLETVDRTIINIIRGMEDKGYIIDSYSLYVTDNKGNFRRKLDKEYKAHRKKQPKPIHLGLIFDYLRDSWNTTKAIGEEADDRLGIEQCQAPAKSTCIVSTDKDLNMIPGYHYNYVKDELYYTEPWDGLKLFYKQAMTGDMTDNIKGIPYVGPAKAAKAIENCTSEEELCEAAYSMYLKHYMKVEEDASEAKKKAKEDFIKTARLVWIRRKDSEIWQPPIPL